MKKHVFDSLSAFFADITNKTGNGDFLSRLNRDYKSWIGLSKAELKQYQFSYPIGVAELKNFKEIEIQKAEKIRYFNQFDGFDIDIDRMLENLDFLIDERRRKRLPKTIDIYVNICEGADISYSNMLNKTYAAAKIIDHLESLGVRCALYSVISLNVKFNSRRQREHHIVEICVKNYHDNLNLGALCTAISPWMLRHWGSCWLAGNIPDIAYECGRPAYIPSEAVTPNSIVIDTNQCLSVNTANSRIQSLKIA